MTVGGGKRGQATFDGIENGGQVFGAHLECKTRSRPNAQRTLGGGAFRRAK